MLLVNPETCEYCCRSYLYDSTMDLNPGPSNADGRTFQMYGILFVVC